LGEGSLVAKVRVLGAVEEGKELKVFVLGDGIVFVGVTLRAGHGRSHPGLHRGVDPINNGNVAELLVVGAAFVVGEGVSVEGGGDQLIAGRILEEVAGELLDGKLIKGHVGVESADDPVAIPPDGAWRVVGVSSGVRVAGEIEPAPGPVFAIAWLGELAIDVFRKGIL